MVRAVIADDEEHVRAYLSQLLVHEWPELELVGSAASGIEALQMIDDLSPNVVFLDIRMPGLNGMEVAQRMVAAMPRPHIVFVTAHEQYAVSAFEASAVDYLLKPPTPARLAQSIAKIKHALARPPAVSPEALQELFNRLQAPVRSARLALIRAAVGDEVRVVHVSEVAYFQSKDKYTSVFTSDSELLIRTTVGELRTQLDPEHFWQIHRGIIVAVREIQATKTDFRGRLTVRLRSRGELLVVSRSFAHLFKQM